jgi:transketolase
MPALSSGTAPWAATEELARGIRIEALKMTHRGGSSHVGSCLSVADILAVLYGRVMHHNPGAPDDPERDRLIVSKGHASAALYAVLALRGYFSPDMLKDHCSDGSTLCGHVSHHGNPGVEVSTGALGHGLSIGAGMALAVQRRRVAPVRVFVVLSDGECDEGSVWEAAMFAGHHQLGSLTAIIDYNKLQSLASTTETLDLEPFGQKWRSFGWDVREVDGHDHLALDSALMSPGGSAPRCVIAHTTKGKGVSFMENAVLWHYRAPNAEELEVAVAEITATR